MYMLNMSLRILSIYGTLAHNLWEEEFSCYHIRIISLYFTFADVLRFLQTLWNSKSIFGYMFFQYSSSHISLQRFYQFTEYELIINGKKKFRTIASKLRRRNVDDGHVFAQ
jgi:hypothetical protein